MAIDYDEAWRQATAYIDAFNRHDLDAYEAQFHDEVIHGSVTVDDRTGQENSFVYGKQAHRDYITWLWKQNPGWRNVLQEVFVGPHGYAFLTRLEPDGWQVVWVRELGADGLVAHLVLYGECRERRQRQQRDQRHHPAQLPLAVSRMEMEQESHGSISPRAGHWSSDSL